MTSARSVRHLTLEQGMNLDHLADGVLTYTSRSLVDYGAGGQIYGSLGGSITGERLAGDLQLTNLATKRPDDVNLPTLRGILTTGDDVSLYVAMDGIALARSSDGARVIAMMTSFRTGDERYSWLNSVFVVGEAILNSGNVGGKAFMRLYTCDPTIEFPPGHTPMAPADRVES